MSNENVNEIQIENIIEEFIFNSEITDEEILHSVKLLRRGKSPGEDNIIPEFFISSIDIFYLF